MNVHYDPKINTNDRACKVILKGHQRRKFYENNSYANVFKILQLYKWNFIHKIIHWKNTSTILLLYRLLK